MATSFLQAAASTEKVNAPPALQVVQTEGLVLLKIIKHCKDLSPSLVTGQLLGLDIGTVLEVTNCFPFPNHQQENDINQETDDIGANYQLDMMRCLRDSNADSNVVGWYQSTPPGGCFQSVEFIETFMNYKENIGKCVCIIYDPSRSNIQGGLAGLKALKLSDTFLELYRNGNFSGESLRDKNISWADVFEEITIRVSNSALVSAFMSTLEPDRVTDQSDHDRLQISSKPLLESNVEFLIRCMDDLSTEQKKLKFYFKDVTRQQAWVQERRDENEARKAAGEDPLPEGDSSNPFFKPIPEPSRLESLLITNRIADYCNQIHRVAGHSFSRLSLIKALHDD